MDVAQAHALEGRHLLSHRRHGAEEIGRFGDGHVEHVGYRLVLEFDLERLAVVALAVALIAGDVDIREEVHLDLNDAVALAALAAPALDIEREAPRAVAPRLGLREPREPVADRR